MHPAIVGWFHAQRARVACGDWSGCGPGAQDGGAASGWAASCGPGGDRREPGGSDWGEDDSGGGGGGGGGPFGVRRPLRFLAYKLELDDKQVAELARILDELKTERAQGEVDRRRTVSAFADAVTGETFDVGKAGEGAKLRVESATRLRDAVMKALREIHAMLDPEKRAKLAYLIRTGTLSI